MYKRTFTFLFIQIKFPTLSRACLQQLLKVTSKSDERCMLLQGKCNTGYSSQYNERGMVSNFLLVSKVKCAKFNQDWNVGQQRVLQLVQFFYFFTFLKSQRSCLQPPVKVSSQSDERNKIKMQGNTGYSSQYNILIFKFPKSPWACLQQLVKVSSQSDERCGLLYGTDRQTFIFIYKIKFPIPSRAC